jgi:hypothetical protein
MKLVKKTVKVAVLAILAATLYFSFTFNEEDAGTIKVSDFGKQPAIAVDNANNLHVVFGQADEIFYTSSRNGGSSFATPQPMGRQDKLALGMTRGPQVITTRDYVVIAAADHTGKIMAYRLKNNESEWGDPVNILNGDTTAKEGFIAIASGKENNVYAAWLDLRIGKKNNIFSAFSSDGGKTWSESKLVYASPEGRVCPCCRPSITADRKGNVYVMFRNDLNGARDLYVARSKDGGRSFAPAQKLGEGTWIFDKCPMDGGGISTDAKGKVGTTWRRENTVYYSEPGMPERKIGEGRASSLVKNSRGNYLVWQRGTHIMALTPDELGSEIIGTGIYPRLASLRDESVICIWESEGKIVAKKLP